MNPEHDALGAVVRRAEAWVEGDEPQAIDLERRDEMVHAVLEDDQLVTAKERVRFGQRQLSGGVHALLWSLRFYVVAMMALVVIQVLHAVQGGH